MTFAWLTTLARIAKTGFSGSLRVKLGSRNQSSSDGRGEGRPVGGGGDHMLGIVWLPVRRSGRNRPVRGESRSNIGSSRWIVRSFHPMCGRRGAFSSFLTTPGIRPRQGGPVFFGVIEQHLHSDTDSKQWNLKRQRVFSEACVVETVHDRCGGSDPREDHRLDSDEFRRGGEPCAPWRRHAQGPGLLKPGCLPRDR